MILANYKTTILTLIIPLLVSCGGGGGGSASEIPAIIPTISVSAASGNNGSISPASVSVTQGQTATFTVTADTGYSVSSISGCNGTLSETTFITGAITSSCSVTVSFATYMSTVFETSAYEFPYPEDALNGLCAEDPSSIPVSSSIFLPIDFNRDSFNDLIVSYFCSPKVSGQYLDTPTPDAIIAFQNNGDKTFSLANTAVFGLSLIHI